jgi:hypothetical protein
MFRLHNFHDSVLLLLGRSVSLLPPGWYLKAFNTTPYSSILFRCFCHSVQYSTFLSWRRKMPSSDHTCSFFNMSILV